MCCGRCAGRCGYRGGAWGVGWRGHGEDSMGGEEVASGGSGHRAHPAWQYVVRAEGKPSSVANIVDSLDVRYLVRIVRGIAHSLVGAPGETPIGRLAVIQVVQKVVGIVAAVKPGHTQQPI